MGLSSNCLLNIDVYILNAVLNLDLFFYGGEQLMQGLIPGESNVSK